MRKMSYLLNRSNLIIHLSLSNQGCAKICSIVGLLAGFLTSMLFIKSITSSPYMFQTSGYYQISNASSFTTIFSSLNGSFTNRIPYSKQPKPHTSTLQPQGIPFKSSGALNPCEPILPSIESCWFISTLAIPKSAMQHFFIVMSGCPSLSNLARIFMVLMSLCTIPSLWIAASPVAIQ